MRIIDLSKTIEHGMNVYPGDPAVSIRETHSLDKEGWRLKYLRLGSHTGTHVDAPSHMIENGETLDRLPLDRFFGKAMVVDLTADTFPEHIGLIFRGGEINQSVLEAILRAHPPFVATGDEAVLPLEIEKEFLMQGILTFTDLINLSLLPQNEEIMFFGIPLKIKNGDGSPVRAFVTIDT